MIQLLKSEQSSVFTTAQIHRKISVEYEPPHFWATDSRTLFEYNLKHQPEDWIYRTKPVHYSINSQGYRCPEFDQVDWNNSILMFGCSNIFGTGVDDNEIISSLVSKQLNMPVINLAVCGSDDLLHFINSNILYEAGVRPRAVVYIWPGIYRISELLGNNKVKNWGSWNCQINNWATGWITNEVHTFEFLNYLSLAVNNLWDCPILEYNCYLHGGDDGRELNGWLGGTHRLLTTDEWPTIKGWGHVIDPARDIGRDGNYHPGIQTHRSWADAVLRDFDSIGIK